MYRSSESSSSGAWAQLIAYAIFFGFWAMVAEMGGCAVEEGRFRNAIRNEGLTEAVQSDYDWFECGYGDVWVSSFRAKRGEAPIAGTACCGIFKGCAVRWQ